MELSANFLDSDCLSALNPYRPPFFWFCLVEYFHQQLKVLSDSTLIILESPYCKVETDIQTGNICKLGILKYNSQRERDLAVKRKKPEMASTIGRLNDDLPCSFLFLKSKSNGNLTIMNRLIQPD